MNKFSIENIRYYDDSINGRVVCGDVKTELDNICGIKWNGGYWLGFVWDFVEGETLKELEDRLKEILNERIMEKICYLKSTNRL